MAEFTDTPVLLNIGIQTDDALDCLDAVQHPISDDKQHHTDIEDCSDSDSSLGIKRMLNHCSAGTCDTESESSCPNSVYTSCSSTRRNSLVSGDSDMEIPFQLLFRTSSGSSNISSRGNVDSPLAPSNASNVLNGLDVLLQRITCERFLELRRIQLGDRPVTGSDSRQNLESFFHRAIHGPTEEERQQSEQANRPDHVADDVNSLQQSALVRGALQNTFRQQLEETLRSRLPSTPVQERLTQQRLPQPIAQQRQHSPQNVQQQPPSVGGSQFRSQLERLFSNQVSNTSVTNRTPTQLTRRPVPSPGVSSSVPQPPSPHQTTDQPAHNVAHPQTSNLHITIETGLQLLSESIAEDLTRLQSLQVVSNMLGTDFRNELEDMVQGRVDTVGNGQAVQNIIQSLPRQNVRDTPARPSGMATNRTSYVDEELNAMRRQMDEMKRMMAMSMEIQMDTQRAIRQEVSAIFSTFMQDYLLPRAALQQQSVPAQPTAFQPIRSQPMSAGQCVICTERSVDTLLYQCGHMCVCHQCGLQLKMDGHNCPMCRAPIRDIVRAYQTQQ